MFKLGFIYLIKLEAKIFILFIKKKGIMEFYFCINYCGINAITISNRYSIFLISEILNRLGRTVIFIKLDLKDIYNFICIYQKNEWKITFYNQLGLYEYFVLFFGLYNVPTIFQVFIN